MPMLSKGAPECNICSSRMAAGRRRLANCQLYSERDAHLKRILHRTFKYKLGSLQ